MTAVQGINASHSSLSYDKVGCVKEDVKSSGLWHDKR